MSWWEAIFLGALQGITEFLPISSSGHLVLFQKMFGWDNPDNAQEWFFDGVLHFGTLVAVLIYFGKELRQGLQSVMRSNGEVAAATWPASYRDAFYLLVLVGIASVPAALAVLVKSDDIKQSFKQPGVVALNFILLGFVLIMTGFLKPGKITGPQMRWYHALAMGVAQGCAALMRGLSRSGSTLAVALLVSLEKSWAVRFSFMMSVVASLGLGASGIWKALKDPSLHEWLTGDFLLKTIVATLVSAIVAYLTITPLIALVKQAKLWIFGVYVWLVAASYFAWIWLA
ncbi:MAG: undecaprenyl-diphosphate phosphatase [Planctomycetia bacterium]|nr:undecaprenyl-diphosphate phosphatase [Planctomycetia bacterium]